MNTNMEECIYCKERTVQALPMKTNVTEACADFLIAQGDKKKEIVFWERHLGTFGVEINFCPMCGRKLN